MKKITHGQVWKNKPSESTVFVSDYLESVQHVLKKEKNIKKVLDIACGNGLGVTVPLLKQGYEVYAFDHFKSAINALKMNAKGFKVHAKKADMYKRFPYPDNSFDAAFCFQAIYHGHINQIRTTLSEIRRVVKKGGYFFVNFLPYEVLRYDKKSKKFYHFRLKDLSSKKREVVCAYKRLDKEDPHVFYSMSRNFEWNVPHYHIRKSELRQLLNEFFTDIVIKQVSRKMDTKWFFWMAYGKVK
jgi:ubiquinone/menaquinone biosynthesis C-methylase UbiE